MDLFKRRVGQLRKPLFDEHTLRITLLALLDDMKVPCSCQPYASRGVPTCIVRMNIMVYQLLLKVIGPEAPVLFEVKGKVRSDNLASAIAHVTSRVKFPHECIN